MVYFSLFDHNICSRIVKCTYFQLFHLCKLFYYISKHELGLCSVLLFCFCFFLLVLPSHTHVQFWKTWDQKQTIQFKRPYFYFCSSFLWFKWKLSLSFLFNIYTTLSKGIGSLDCIWNGSDLCMRFQCVTFCPIELYRANCRL